MSERWMPEIEDVYWTVDFGYTKEVRSVRWVNDKIDNMTYKSGNCFRTEAEAEAAAEKVKALLLSLHEEQPVTDCNQLPRLTAEVFDRPDCPEWAKYAAVDIDGRGFFYKEKPRVSKADGEWLVDKCITGLNLIISDDFDPTDWQNSLIERSIKETKLPEWCKNGALAWENGDYLELEVIDEDHQITMKYSDGTEESVIADYIGKHVKQARLRPYNADEMKALMGKVIEKGPSLHIVTGFENVFDNECMVHVNGCLYGANDLLRQFTIDNAPCGVLEHLENGKWVE